MRRSAGKRLRHSVSRSAFTLVEMLVSVTLVLMMMTLFASIFQMATGSMSTQRAISENDQRARSLTTVIRKDFQHRTFRYPFAFYPTEDSATSPTSFSNRSGYLYISTNDPYSGLDDIIQYTVSANILSEDPDGTPFFGSAAELVDRRSSGAATTGLAISPNQPETDDGSIAPNFVASSSAAEICYFVRHGNLYRRALLIREPLAFSGQNLAPQPTSASGYNYFAGQPDTTDPTTYDGLFLPNGGVLTYDFYRFFDHSAYANLTGGLQRTAFLGIASLSNQTNGAAGDVLGMPQFRFGFNPIFGGPFTGLSREHNVHPSAGIPLFIGRFLKAEMSTRNFNWPQGFCGNEPPDSDYYNDPPDPPAPITPLAGTNGNPLDLINSPLALNSGNGLVSAFDGSQNPAVEGRGGNRRMEDLLLANVHEMKVEIWDDRLGRYVTPGYGNQLPGVAELIGDYHTTRNLNPSFGPLGVVSAGRVFDTWHPQVDLDGDATFENPPYLPYSFYPPRVSDVPPGPSPSTMASGPFATYWTANTPYSQNDVVFASRTELDSPPDGFQYDEIAEPKFNIAYRCVVAGTSGGGVPVFPTASGRRLTEGTVVWESFDNRRPLRSIRLQIRFQDKTSDTMRQLSLIIPMTEVK